MTSNPNNYNAIVMDESYPLTPSLSPKGARVKHSVPLDCSAFGVGSTAF